jgi:DNA-binding NarL/FixJ family response regulator
MITVALVDDHTLLRQALVAQVNSLDGYRVILEAGNGKIFIQQLDPQNLPHLILLDILMPVMNGFETASWICSHYPQIKIIALSMLQDETNIISMLRNGAKGYLLKDADIGELHNALNAVTSKGIYFNRLLFSNLSHTFTDGPSAQEAEQRKAANLTAREKEFLQWLCTDKSYKEIAAAMFVSPRTVDGYRDALFEKINVASRIGLVVFAIRHHIVEL